jgi:mannose-6-phosphate isomerase-like protein (cupin superfamily)
VLDGQVRMHVRDGGGERIVTLAPGTIFHAHAGDEHRAEPLGEARILVIEKSGSI